MPAQGITERKLTVRRSVTAERVEAAHCAYPRILKKVRRVNQR